MDSLRVKLNSGIRAETSLMRSLGILSCVIYCAALLILAWLGLFLSPAIEI